MAADREAWVLGLDRGEDRSAAEVLARAALVAVALRRGVDDEDGVLGQRVELGRRGVLVRGRSSSPTA